MSVTVAIGVACLLAVAFYVGTWWVLEAEMAVADDEEGMVAMLMADLAVEQDNHAAEQARADELAGALGDLLYGGASFSVDRAVVALAAHNGARVLRG